MLDDETPRSGTMEPPVGNDQPSGSGIASKPMEECENVVKQFKHGEVTFANAILKIQTIFHDSIQPAGSESGGTDFNSALTTYLDMLQEAVTDNRNAIQRGKRAGAQIESGGTDIIVPDGEESQGRNSPNADIDEVEAFTNKRKRTDDDCFTWAVRSEIARTSMGPELTRTLDTLDKWSTDPKFIRSKILLAPDCPDFPPDQWLNIVQGNVVDLDKVLTAHYSTDTEQKQVQEMGIFQISLRTSNTSRFIKTQADWSIAHYKYVRAIAFVLPWMRDSIQTYHDFILQMFASFHISAHSYVICFDRAVRLRVAHQKHIRLDDVAKFDDLRIIHLNPYGTVAFT
ncbi:hypothetical protein BJ138DRAFT_1124813, partial [Hygrophoropsis aurantiaca]